jgi:hypothetical protein
MVPPQPSGHGPHVMPEGQLVAGVQPVVHVPLTHAAVAAQVPQLMEPPQPLGHRPHVMPVGHVVSGTHATHLPSMQLAPPSQVPHWSRPPSPQPFGYSPHS